MGWFTGGGHGPLSSTYGMGSDNVLEATVVLMNGTVVTTNPCSHPELFYAIRGGGGGTYGVITSVIMKAYPTPRTTTWSLLVTLLDPGQEDEWWALMAQFSKGQKELKDGGVQGYYYMAGPPLAPTLMLAAFFNVFDKPNGTVAELFKPFKQRLDRMNGTVDYQSDEATMRTFFESYSGDTEAELVASNIALGSRLLPAEAFEDVEEVSRVFQEVGPTMDPNKVRPFTVITAPKPSRLLDADAPKTGGTVIIGHMIANSNNRDLETALNPAWRDTVAHLAVGGGWADGASAEEIQAVRDDVTHRQVAALRKLAPDSGAYFNEVSTNVPVSLAGCEAFELTCL